MGVIRAGGAAGPDGCPGTRAEQSAMNATASSDGLKADFDIPVLPGMDATDIQTPCPILDLDAPERIIVAMDDDARTHGLRRRAHGKMHKSVDPAGLQERPGGAVGVCRQKDGKAEVLARGGIGDILMSNRGHDPGRRAHPARLPE